MKKHSLQENYERFFGKLNEAATPWGQSDQDREIVPGVTWYSTPSHGGLRVAGKYLSPAAKELALFSGGSYWFEEDVAWAIPVYENYEKWGSKFFSVLGGQVVPKEELEDTIKNYFAQYFEKGFSDSATQKSSSIKNLKPGDKVYFVAGYERHNPFTIINTTSSGSYIVTDKVGNRYKLTKQRIKRDLDRIEPA